MVVTIIVDRGDDKREGFVERTCLNLYLLWKEIVLYACILQSGRTIVISKKDTFYRVSMKINDVGEKLD